MKNTVLRISVPAFVFAFFLAATAFSSSGYAAENKDEQEPITGELLLPKGYESAEEKKCMTVCEEWGENCIINPATGSRKCRRVCKSFTEECF